MDGALIVLLVVGALLLLTFLVVVFIVPTTREGKKRKAGRQKTEVDEAQMGKLQKDNQHLQSVIGALRKQIAALETGDKDWGKRIAVEEAKVKKLQDKLLQERQWQEKETEKYNKKAQEVQACKDELKKVQEGLSAEHSQTIRLEGEIRDWKEKHTKLTDERRKLEVELIQLKGKFESTQDNLRQLKKDNAALQKQKDDTTFVAKSDYLALEAKLKEAQSEIQQLRKAQKSA